MRVTIELPDDFTEQADNALTNADSVPELKLLDTVRDAVNDAHIRGDQPYVFVTFEATMSLYESGYRKESEPEAVTVGPFNWVQLTYELLRYAPDGASMADYMQTAWKIHDNAIDKPKWLIQLLQWSPWYSDIIIHRAPPTREYPAHRVILTQNNDTG